MNKLISISAGPYFSSFLLLVSFLFGFSNFSEAQQAESLRKADSFFMKNNYAASLKLYRRLRIDSSHDALHLNRLGYSEYAAGHYEMAVTCYRKALASAPLPPLKGVIWERLARIASLRLHRDEALDGIDSALQNGFMAIKELDTLRDFNPIRKQKRFIQARSQLFNSLYPCFADAHAREFDFWIGEWEVFVTGTGQYAGHSIIQEISGGCAILENWSSGVSEGKSLNFVDDSTKKWKQVWIGSYPGGKQDFVNGEYKEGRMQFSFELKDSSGKKIAGRFTFFNLGPNQVRQLNETSTDDGQTWTTSYDFTYNRIKASAKTHH